MVCISFVIAAGRAVFMACAWMGMGRPVHHWSAFPNPESPLPPRLDRFGDLHIAWAEGNRIVYARLPGAVLAEVDGLDITTLALGTGASVVGPRLGLSDGWIYLFWSVLNRTGLEAGSAYTAYTAFPRDDPDAQSPPARILIMPDEDQPYEAHSGVFSITQLVRTSSVAASTDFVYEPMPAQGDLPELAIALAVKQNYRQDTQIQTCAGCFGGGAGHRL